MPKRALFGLAVLALVACRTREAPEQTPPGATEIRISVDATGYHPARTHAPAGKPVRLIVTRTSDEGCGQKLVVPSAGLERELPLQEPVTLDLTMPAAGELAFTCGMDMLRGAIVAD